MKKVKLYAEAKEVTIREGFENFIEAKIALNRSPETIKFYQARFSVFLDFVENEKKKTLTSELTDIDVNQYIIYRRKKNPAISNITINTELRSIRAVLYYFMNRGNLAHFKIPLITTKKPIKDGYTEEEQELLIKKPDLKKCTFPEYRNWVIVCHLLASGNRSRTVRGIKNKHVDLKNRVILLDEVKNNQSYEIPISNEYLPILREYMSHRKGDPDDYLFCNQFGRQLSADGLKVVMRKYNLAHGVDKTSVHKFRHTFAKNWILEGGSAKKLQSALGHSNPTMVDEYLSLYGRELRDDFGKYAPLSNLKGKLEKKKISLK